MAIKPDMIGIVDLGAALRFYRTLGLSQRYAALGRVSGQRSATVDDPNGNHVSIFAALQ